jgi:transposase
MAQAQYIKHLYENEEKSLREIARITELSFQTVQKYAFQSNWNENHLPNTEPERYPALGKYIPIIDDWLEEDTRQPRKQRHTMTRIYHRLQKEWGFEGCYSSVKRYVRKKKYLMKEVAAGHLPISQPMGQAQVDFGEFKYYDGLGQDHTAHALTISFPFSNMAFTQVFKSQNQECLLEGMERIFVHTGGVPVRIRADNMTTAVAHVLKGTERELSDGFSRFMLHYRFAADFCNPASGNEKGNVENKVGYSRRNFFVPVPTIENFEEYNQQLWKLCEEDGEREHYKRGVPIKELWEQERKRLLALPEHEYIVFRYESARISNYGYVTVDTNKYGLSPDLSGQTAQVKIYFDRIELFYEHTLLKVYQRSYGRNEEIVDWKQYVGILCKKPGAVEHTRFFNQLPKLWQEHLKSTEGKERKTALMLLREIVQEGNAELCDGVLSLAGRYGRTDTESLRQCYYNLTKKEQPPEPLTLGNATPRLNYIPNLSAYDSLTGGEMNA